MKTIQLSCGGCANLFEKPLKEHTRQVKKGRTQFFCSLSCSARVCLVPHSGPPKPHNLKRGKGDEYSPYRFFLKQANKRTKYNKTRTCDIDLPYLKTLWEEQRGICPLTGWSLRLTPTMERSGPALPHNASLDRIDNSKGYVRGNIRFVALIANYARNAFTDEDVVSFAKAVVGSLP